MPKKAKVSKKRNSVSKKMVRPDHTYKVLFVLGILLIFIIITALFIRKSASAPTNKVVPSQTTNFGY